MTKPTLSPADAARLAQGVLSRRARGADDWHTVPLKEAEQLARALEAAHAEIDLAQKIASGYHRRCEVAEAELARLRAPTGDAMEECTLAECPPGHFLFKDLWCFKSEYKTESMSQPGVWQSDAYNEAGEYFWGGVSNPVEREKLLVRPMEPSAAIAAAEVRGEPAVRERLSQNPASFDASKWDKASPRPWRVEEDWTREITASNGYVIAKLPYGAADPGFHAAHNAALIVAAVNHQADVDAATQAGIRQGIEMALNFLAGYLAEHGDSASIYDAFKGVKALQPRPWVSEKEKPNA